MLEQLVLDYAAYFKPDALDRFRTVQDVVDNMLTRLEEVTSILQMIKNQNNECGAIVTEELSKYRSELIILTKKIATVNNFIVQFQNNIETLEKQVEKAEMDFGINSENKIKSLLKPFLKKDISQVTTKFEKLQFKSVLNNFRDNNT